MPRSLKTTLSPSPSPIKIYAPRNREERRQKAALVKKGYTLTTEGTLDMNAGIVIGENTTAPVAEVTPEVVAEAACAPLMVQVTLSEAEYLAVQKAIHSALPKVSLPAVGRVARTVATAPFRALAFTGGLLVRGVVAAAVGSGIGQAARTGFGK